MTKVYKAVISENGKDALKFVLDDDRHNIHDLRPSMDDIADKYLALLEKTYPNCPPIESEDFDLPEPNKIGGVNVVFYRLSEEDKDAFEKALDERIMKKIETYAALHDMLFPRRYDEVEKA